MQPKIIGKYELRDLHKEIDLLDRKLMHCGSIEKYDCADSRAAAVGKLTTRRATLVKAAMEAASRGIECDPKYLPRSFRAAADPKVEV